MSRNNFLVLSEGEQWLSRALLVTLKKTTDKGGFCRIKKPGKALGEI